MKKSAVLALLMILGCTTATSPPPQTSEFKNLQVFPRDIPHDELIAAMKGFTRALGVRCDFCHVVTATTPEMEFDFPNDTKDEKKNARVMLRMTMDVNREWVPKIIRESQDQPAMVSCWTCHRGKSKPENPPPPPPAR
ncbi:MAG TPA: c-type cytochrome [Thermoanaerobaculia bacterium]|nr:c-type cytochrome [Thermoanaerobaculia bacterium]